MCPFTGAASCHMQSCLPGVCWSTMTACQVGWGLAATSELSACNCSSVCCITCQGHTPWPLQLSCCMPQGRLPSLPCASPHHTRFCPSCTVLAKSDQAASLNTQHACVLQAMLMPGIDCELTAGVVACAGCHDSLYTGVVLCRHAHQPRPSDASALGERLLPAKSLVQMVLCSHLGCHLSYHNVAWPKTCQTAVSGELTYTQVQTRPGCCPRPQLVS